MDRRTCRHQAGSEGDSSADAAAPILHLLAGKGVDGRAEEPDQGEQRDDTVENENADPGEESAGHER